MAERLGVFLVAPGCEAVKGESVGERDECPCAVVWCGGAGTSQVTVVDKTPHGALAVGMSAGKPFAVSNRCRHLFAPWGKGK